MYSEIAANKRKTVLLVAIFIAFVATVGYVFGLANGSPGLVYFFGIGALIYSIFTYFLSAKIAVGMAGAKEIAKSDAPELYRIVENLSIASGITMPKVYIIPDPAPNAFAAGRNPKTAVVGVTTGLLEVLDKTELEGVIAHELSHIRNYDVRLMSVVTALVSVIAIMSDFFFHLSFFGRGDDEEGGSHPAMIILGIAMAILAPIIATIIQLSISRKREYLADASGVLLTRYPDGLASALEKISQSDQPLKRASSATAHLYISNPLGGKGIGSAISKLFSTHPPIQDRINKLHEMEGKV